MLEIIITTRTTDLTNSIKTLINLSKVINVLKHNISKNKKIYNET